MQYIIRKILSAILPFLIIAVCIHGVLVEFTTSHFYIIGISALVLSLIRCGKTVRKIIYFPINLIRRVLFRL
jgi:uncharacterized membrane protein YvlD (DUF360 family)